MLHINHANKVANIKKYTLGFKLQIISRTFDIGHNDAHNIKYTRGK